MCNRDTCAKYEVLDVLLQEVMMLQKKRFENIELIRNRRFQKNWNYKVVVMKAIRRSLIHAE
jgi:hypothetical protein